LTATQAPSHSFSSGEQLFPPVAASPLAPASPTRGALPAAPTLPPVKGETKEGLKYTKDFDAKFLQAQHALLIEARVSLTGQAVRLED
jgi:hypothetical protein